MIGAQTSTRASPTIRSGSPLTLAIAGVCVNIMGMPQHIRADIAALLRPFVVRAAPDAAGATTVAIDVSQSPTAPGDDWVVTIDDAQVLRTGSPERLVKDLEWLIVSQAVARSSSRVIWHAASLAQRRRAVTLIAESGAGKSTLTVGLAMRGWRPLADDLSLYDPLTNNIVPFRRCFHVSPEVAARAAVADALTWPAPALRDYARPRRWAVAGAKPTWLIIVRRDTSQPSNLAPISRAEAAGALFAATVRNGVESPARVAAAVAGAAQSCWSLNNNDLTAALDLLESTLLAQSAPLIAHRE